MKSSTISLQVRAKAEKERRRRLKENPLWEPNDGPQTWALKSNAVIVGYGGAAGGGKTDLGVGLAATEHARSVIFRRVFPNLREIIERSREIFNPKNLLHSRDRFNETLHRWVLSDGRIVEFEACQYEKDKFKQRGRPRDLYVFDEATEFTRTQFEFITSWLRSTDPNQRKRILLTFNPPTDEEGSWVVDYFLPWLAYLHPETFQHPNPAMPTELRWYATIEGEEKEFLNGEPLEHDGEIITPQSRTFIPAKLEDNPYLSGTGYHARLQANPEPLRSQLLYGDFGAVGKADPWQVIPASWVRAAQRRWLEREKPKMPLSGVGVDLARGGKDAFVLSKRYGTWFDEVLKIPGIDVEDGPVAAKFIYDAVEKEGHIRYLNLDIIGIGSSPYDSTKAIFPDITYGVNAARGSAYIYKDPSKRPVYKMRNVRAEYHWKMREALDPEYGDDIALPPSNEILADLCAPRYKLMAGGVGHKRIPTITIEEKEAVKTRLGRSPDVGEAIMLANFKTTVDRSDLLGIETKVETRWDELNEYESNGVSRWLE
jgi:hypothetical protein